MKINVFRISFGFACFIMIGLFIFSPFRRSGSGTLTLTGQTEIEKPCSRVYAYLGNSNNASHWSSYVDHIKPLNPREFVDGQKGSLRRCFKEANETGFTWDEEILETRQNNYRKLSCFNYKELGFKAPNMVTEQIFTPDNGRCTLSFTLQNNEAISLWDRIKMKYGAYVVQSIFQTNLSRIKQIVEAS